jgi:protein-tyrosine phosphatase
MNRRAVDLHCHLLPAVDDGPDRLEESVEYAREAVARGTGTIVATPHVEQVDVSTIADRVREVQGALDAEGIDLRVVPGGELKPASIGELDAEELELLAHGPPDARWLLYEVPFSGVGEEFLDGARELRERGYGLLLAHPERSRGFLETGAALLDPLVAAGALFAVNVGPLTGHEKVERTEAARQLAATGMAHLVATDAHPPRRPYQLADAEAWVGRAAFTDVPARLLSEGVAGYKVGVCGGGSGQSRSRSG